MIKKNLFHDFQLLIYTYVENTKLIKTKRKVYDCVISENGLLVMFNYPFGRIIQ